MQSWRITKYDPSLRDSQGRYAREDWTACTDLGKVFAGKALVREGYLQVEDAYVGAVAAFMAEASVDRLRVVDLEDHDASPSRKELGLDRIVPSGIDGSWLDREQVEDVCRLCLREIVWCRLEDPGRMFVHFGYDYYMYVGSSGPSIASIADAERHGLFVEPMKSPYMTQ